MYSARKLIPNWSGWVSWSIELKVPLTVAVRLAYYLRIISHLLREGHLWRFLYTFLGCPLVVRFFVSMRSLIILSSLVMSCSSLLEQWSSVYNGDLGSVKSALNLFSRFAWSSGMWSSLNIAFFWNNNSWSGNVENFVSKIFLFWVLKCYILMIKCKRTLSEKIMLL